MKLSELKDDMLVFNGAYFRHFNVGRLDAKDVNDDYYDMMLINLNNAFYLVNITIDSHHRGTIEISIRNCVSEYYISGIELKKYFKKNKDIFLLMDSHIVNVDDIDSDVLTSES